MEPQRTVPQQIVHLLKNATIYDWLIVLVLAAVITFVVML